MILDFFTSLTLSKYHQQIEEVPYEPITVMPHPPTPGGEIGGGLSLRFIPRVGAFTLISKKLLSKLIKVKSPLVLRGLVGGL